MLKKFNQQFFTLDPMSVINQVHNNFNNLCQALKIIPKESLSFVTNTKPLAAGSHLNVDVLVDFGQKILVMREIY